MDAAAANPERPPESLGLLLGLVRAEVVRALDRELSSEGVDLRFGQVKVLKCLYRRGPMSASELARSLCHDGGAMTRVLDQLESRDLLRRKPDPQDRRALRIELTNAGQRLCKHLHGCFDRVLDDAQSALSASERRQLVDFLQRVLATLRQAD